MSSSSNELSTFGLQDLSAIRRVKVIALTSSEAMGSALSRIQATQRKTKLCPKLANLLGQWKYTSRRHRYKGTYMIMFKDSSSWSNTLISEIGWTKGNMPPVMTGENEQIIGVKAKPRNVTTGTTISSSCSAREGDITSLFFFLI